MRRLLARHATFAVMSCLTLAAAVAVALLKGEAALRRALSGALDLAAFIFPVLGAGLLLAATMRQLLPEGALSRWLGAESGLRGLLLASLAGIVTPGGPIAAFPLVLVLLRAGADRGAVVAFILSWALNGFQRILIWEIPLLGLEFSALRFLACLPLAVAGGLIARRMPASWQPEAR
ncbi:MAG: permease [Acetobacteraceae bacterium]|nr:permease [Acetobacteraceae bacterium]MCX7684401.1 permease [Acetobacteraceae bacterium]MDW8396953.1 permease [Acetobacteraceae bacterium]